MAEQQRWQSVGKSAAEGYEQLVVPTIFAPWASTLIEAAAVRPGESVLDVACGTGVVARFAASQVGDMGRVVGLDFKLASGPAAIFGNISDATFAAVVRDVREAVGADVGDDGLISPAVANIVLAAK